jgi:hypothetical protein
MNIRKTCATLALAWGASRAANLQPQDILFVSTHKNPTEVVGDSKNAFLLTEGGILMYDYRRSAWVDNLLTGSSPQTIRYSTSKGRLYVVLQGGRILEYNPVFRRFTDASLEDFQNANDVGSPVDLNGLTHDGNDFFMGDAIRDKYMRKAPINQAKVFEYDNLWVLTAGLGPYYGSSRRKHASSFWFGLDYPATTVIQPEGNDIWFGSCRSDYPVAYASGIAAQSNGALVKAKSDLNSWKAYPAQLEYGFDDGCVRDVQAWKDYIWLATNKGVVRHDPRTGLFRTYKRMLGSTDVRVNALHVHGNQLYIGTERGVGFMDSPDKEDIQTAGGELPVQGGVDVYELASKDNDLWAATRFGLIVLQKGEWKTLNQVSGGKDVPEATQVPVPSMAYHDTSMYWVYGNRIMVKPRKQEQRVLFERDAPFRLRFDGDMLYVGYATGVTAWNLRKGLWTDFQLVDGIPGTRVLAFNVFGGKLWMATDLGVERINTRPYLP